MVRLSQRTSLNYMPRQHGQGGLYKRCHCNRVTIDGGKDLKKVFNFDVALCIDTGEERVERIRIENVL
jgi:hypothetical protein